MRHALRLTTVLALLAGALGVAPLAHAHGSDYGGGVGPETPDDDEPEKNPCDDPESPNKKRFDPVELDSGGVYLLPEDLTSPDLVVPVRGHTIDLRRSYRQHYAYHGALGVGWDFGMNRRLRQLDNGDVRVTSGLCSTEQFAFNGTGWTAPDGSTSTLVQNLDGSYTQTFRSGTEHSFDANGSLVQVIDRHGNAIQLTYSAQKMPIQGISEFFVDTTARVVTLEYRLQTITDPTGRQIQFAYDTNGRIQTITDWISRAWTYGYDTRGNLASVTSPATAEFPSGTTTTYKYEDSRFPNAITKIIAPNQMGSQVAKVTNLFDSEGRVYRQDQGDGGMVLAAYGPNGTTTVTDANGTEVIFQLAGRQVVSETVVTRGVRAGEPVGSEYATTYEFTKKRRSRTVFPEGNALEYVYDANNVDPKKRGNLMQIRHVPKPGSSEPVLVTSFTYKTPFDQIGTITDPRGKVTEFFYDAAHDLERIQFPTVPEGTPQQLFDVNAYGQVESITDENGNVTRFVYDANGYLDQVTQAYGTPRAATTELDPDAVGRPTVVRDPRGHATTLVYNAWDKLELSFAPAPLGYQTQLHYDANGNLTGIDRQSELAGNPQTTTLAYTIFDQVQSITNELGETTSFGYDLNHNRILVTDPELRATATIFDERNLPYQTTDAESRVVRLNYHPNGTLAEVVDGNGHSTDYAPDDFDRLKTITHEGGTTEQFLYDPAGNLTRKTTRAGQHIDFGYDDRNRLRSRTSPTETATFAYDLGGRMTNAANSGATLVFAYDERDQLTSESTTIPGLSTQVVAHQYDAAGNRTRLTYPDGAYVDYVYDELDRLKILRDDASVDQVTYSYDELSRVKHMLRASGVTSDFTYDRASRVKTILHDSPVAGVLESLAYNYSASGSIEDMTDHNGLHVFGYDATYQLTSVDYPAASPFPDITYNYDDAGNRTSTVTSGGTVAYVANALNQYTSVGGVAQTYDLNGNLTSDGTNTYGFDAETRMNSSTTSSGSVSYLYDAFMRRTKKTVAGTATHFLWSRDQLVAEHDASHVRQARYVVGPSHAPLQIGYGAGLLEPRGDVHADHLEAPLTISDTASMRVWHSDFDAFGDRHVDPLSTVELNVRLPGQYLDSESGLHYNRYRYYIVANGRYLSPDPIGQYGGVNLFSYANSNPLAVTDFLGLDPPSRATQALLQQGARMVDGGNPIGQQVCYSGFVSCQSDAASGEGANELPLCSDLHISCSRGVPPAEAVCHGPPGTGHPQGHIPGMRVEIPEN